MKTIIPFKTFFHSSLWVVFFFSFSMLQAQENPPRPVTVELRNAQALNFGSFVVGPLGGSVIISHTGASRDKTGDIFLLDMGLQPSYAIFDVYANPGTLIHIVPPATTELLGSSGGSIDLVVEFSKDTSTGSTFIVTQDPHPLFLGGTLIIPPGGGSFPGIYSGTLTLTINYE